MPVSESCQYCGEVITMETLLETQAVRLAHEMGCSENPEIKKDRE